MKFHLSIINSNNQLIKDEYGMIRIIIQQTSHTAKMKIALNTDRLDYTKAFLMDDKLGMMLVLVLLLLISYLFPVILMIQMLMII
jgi:hypothetical protein